MYIHTCIGACVAFTRTYIHVYGHVCVCMCVFVCVKKYKYIYRMYADELKDLLEICDSYGASEMRMTV